MGSMEWTVLKREMRAQVRERLRRMDESILVQESLSVERQLRSCPAFQNARSVSVYLHMPRGEIRTQDIVSTALQQGKRVVVPQVLDSSNLVVGDEQRTTTMVMVPVRDIRDLTTWPKNRWEIPEPPIQPGTSEDDAWRILEESLGTRTLDVVITPGLAFDERGGRLGHGRGYYDRFFDALDQRQWNTPTRIGIALGCQRVEKVPMDPRRDRPMDVVLFGS